MTVLALVADTVAAQPAANELHQGHVLLTGEEPKALESARQTLEARFPGIRTADMTTSAVFRSDNRPLEDFSHHARQLDCVSLTGDSRLAEPEPSN